MSGLSPAQLQYKPAPDRWSVAECLEHIIVVEGFIVANIERTLERAADSTSAVMSDDELVQRIESRSIRVKGPERVMPTGRWPHDRLLSEFESARKRSIEFAANIKAELRQHTFPHPIFGPFDCYQWILLIGAHGERHRAQAEEVIAGPGFPHVAAAGQGGTGR